MTIIIALAHEDGVTIGSDQMASESGEMFSTVTPKWFQNSSGLWIGVSGALESIQILKSIDEAHPPRYCEEFRNRLRDVEHWGASQEEGQMPWWDLNLLLTDGLRVWFATTSLYPMEIDKAEIGVAGSGHKYARGAMHTELQYQLSKNLGLGMARAFSVVTSGVEAAIHYDNNCGGKPWVETITKKEM
jgi:20S proteasome alpha/beta subunit